MKLKDTSLFLKTFSICNIAYSIDLNGLFEIIERRENREIEILNHWDNLNLNEDTEEPESLGPVFKSIYKERNASTAWIQLINFTEEKLLDIIQEVKKKEIVHRH